MTKDLDMLNKESHDKFIANRAWVDPPRQPRAGDLKRGAVRRSIEDFEECRRLGCSLETLTDEVD